MKKKAFSEFFVVLSLAACILALILLPNISSSATVDGLHLCANTLIPSLFPFFVCANLVAELGLASKLSGLFAPLMHKLFGIGGAGSAAFVLGMIGGYPSGAQMCATLYESGSISKQDAERLVKFCNNAGPAFIFGVMGSGIFGSLRCGILLFLSQLLSALFIGILLKKRSFDLSSECMEQTNAKAFPEAFTVSVKKAGQSILQICMFVTVFSVICAFLSKLFSPIVPQSAAPVLRGMLELSSGAQALQNAAHPMWLKLAIAAFLLAFSGLSVYSQTVSILLQAGLNTDGILTWKLLQGIFAAVCVSLLWLCFPSAQSAADFSTEAGARNIGRTVLYSASAAIIYTLFLKLISRNRKQNYV